MINIILAFSYYCSHSTATLTISQSLIMFFAINGVMLIISGPVRCFKLSPRHKIIMAQPIPRQSSFICTLTAKSEMVRGCCNRQILEDVIILWVGLGCLYFLSTW